MIGNHDDKVFLKRLWQASFGRLYIIDQEKSLNNWFETKETRTVKMQDYSTVNKMVGKHPKKY